MTFQGMFAPCAAAVLVLILLAGGGEAATITVDDSGNADYTKIQDAIDNASDGDTINVGAGMYSEHLLINKNNLTIIGENKNTVILDGGGVGSVVRLFNANYSQITGFTIKNSSSFFPYTYDFESWMLENGYVLKVMSIDNRADPRQVWLQISRADSVIDDVVLTQGQYYSYYNDSNLIINFTVEFIFSGNSVTAVKLTRLYQYSENGTIILINNVTHTFTSGTINKLNWTLNEGYALSLIDIDLRADPRQVWLELSKNDSPVDDKVISQDQIYSYYNGSGKINATVDSIFGGISTDMVKLIDINQLSDLNGTILINNSNHMFISGTANKLDWALSDGYIVSIVDMDIKAYPRQVWIRFSKSNEVFDERVVALDEIYSFYNNSNLIFNATINTVFSGISVNAVRLIKVHQFSDNTGDILINNLTHTFTSGTINKLSWTLNEGYSLSLKDMDIKAATRQVWLELSKNGSPVDDNVISFGQTYTYNNNSELIINASVAEIFSGTFINAVTLVGVNQFSESNRTILIDNLSYTFTYGVINRINWVLKEGYTLSVVDIDSKSYPRRVWLELTKNNIKLNEIVLSVSEIYNYYNSTGASIINGTVDDIFDGSLIIFKNFFQYSEEDGQVLISGITKSITFNSPSANIFLHQSNNNIIQNNIITHPKNIFAFILDSTQPPPPIAGGGSGGGGGGGSVNMGILLDNSHGNAVLDNMVINNGIGIYFSVYSNNNLIYNNHFNNTYNSKDDININIWNVSKMSGVNIIGGSYLAGNFWANPNGTGFSQTCTDADSDGICDSYYTINGTNIDYLPLAYKPETKGDLNRNGRRDTGDATLMLRSIVELPVPSEYLPVLPVGDMNCNNRIDTGDATLVLRDIVNLSIPRCWE